MEHQVEKAVKLDNVLVELASVGWSGVTETPPYPDYALSQRLSDDHSPLRIGNVAAPEVFPRVRSIGFLPPGRSVKMFAVERPLRLLYCVFERDYFEYRTGRSRDFWDEYLGALIGIRNQRLEILMQEIHAELLQPDVCHEFLIESVTNMMLVELARHGRELERRQARQGGSLALAPWQLRRIQERIDNGLERGYPSAGELAELCGISQGHLTRAFKAATGWQLQRYIAEQRIRVAESLLAAEDASCEEVAERLGFGSPAYFSTVFRRMTGKTPTEFRRQALVDGLRPS